MKKKTEHRVGDLPIPQCYSAWAPWTVVPPRSAERLHSTLYRCKTDSENSKPDFVVTQVEPRTQDSVPCLICCLSCCLASWGFSCLPTPPFALQTMNTVYGQISGVQALSAWGRPGGGRGSGDQFQAALGPAPTPVPEAPGCGTVGGCAHIHKAQRNQPWMANRLSKHCW